LIDLGYSLGGCLIIGSLTWGISLAWQDSTGLLLFYLSCAYTSVFGYAGYYYWNNPKNSQDIPQLVGGVFTTVSVCLSPVVTFSLQRYFNWFPLDDGHLPQEVTMFGVGLVAIYFVRFPFLTAPVSLSLYAMSQLDFAQLIFGPDPTLAEQCWVSVGFGAIMILVFWGVDRQRVKSSQQPDFAFWGYLFGTAAFWGGLTVMYEQQVYSTETFKICYFITNLGLMGLSVLLQRYVFAVSGSLGCCYFIVDQLINYNTVKGNSYIAVLFGGSLAGFAYYQSQKHSPNSFVFWAYVFGTAIFWTGMSTLYTVVYNNSQLFGLIYFIVNVGLIFLPMITSQYVFVLFGGLGVFWYVSNLIYTYYWNSWYLPFILTALGLAVIAFVVWFSRHQKRRDAIKNAKNMEELQPLCEVTPQ